MPRTKNVLRVSLKQMGREEVYRRTLLARRRLKDNIIKGYLQIKEEFDTFPFQNALKDKEAATVAFRFVGTSITALVDELDKLDIDKYNEFYADV